MTLDLKIFLRKHIIFMRVFFREVLIFQCHLHDYVILSLKLILKTRILRPGRRFIRRSVQVNFRIRFLCQRANLRGLRLATHIFGRDLAILSFRPARRFLHLYFDRGDRLAQVFFALLFLKSFIKLCLCHRWRFLSLLLFLPVLILGSASRTGELI